MSFSGGACLTGALLVLTSAMAWSAPPETAAHASKAPPGVIFEALLSLGFHISPQQAAADYKEILRGPKSLAEQETALRHDGVPTTAKELRARLPHVPRQQNAAPLWMALRKPLQSLDPPLKTLLSASPDSFRRVERKLGLKLMARQKDILSKILTAADKPHAQFQINWKDLNEDRVQTRKSQTLRNAARLLWIRGAQLAAAGRYSQAVRVEAQGFRIADQAMEDPDPISLLVGTAIDGITLEGMSQLLESAGSRGSVASAIREAILEHQSRFHADRPLWGDVLMDVQIIDQCAAKPELLGQLVGQGKPLTFNLHTPTERRLLSDLIQASGARVLQLQHRLIRSAHLPTYLQQVASSRKQHIDDADIEKRFQQEDPLDILPTTLFLGPLWRPEATVVAQEQILIAAASLLMYHSRHGAFPARLETAVPHSFDPFSGHALRYRREGNGFVIYSVGESGDLDPDRSDIKPGQEASYFRYPGGRSSPTSPSAGAARRAGR